VREQSARGVGDAAFCRADTTAAIDDFAMRFWQLTCFAAAFAASPLCVAVVAKMPTDQPDLAAFLNNRQAFSYYPQRLPRSRNACRPFLWRNVPLLIVCQGMWHICHNS
jgi:hypothetical protein